jgi:hypothetical protein
MPLANYTTKVPCSRSVMLIQEMLARAGSKAVMLDYENNEPCAVTFRIDREKIQLGYRLPCDWRKTLAILQKSQHCPGRYKHADHAKRVAWRCVHDWLRAQLALIEIGAAEIEQVMLPYAITPNGETLYDRIKSGGFLQLTNG